MADIELKHSAKGSTWQKKGAKYVSRVKKNGKWVYQYTSKAANKIVGVNPNYASSKNGMPHAYKNAVSFPLDEEGKAVVDKKAANYNKALYRTTSSKNLALQKQARKRKLHAASINVQRKINKGKKKVSELINRIKKARNSRKKYKTK